MNSLESVVIVTKELDSHVSHFARTQRTLLETM